MLVLLLIMKVFKSSEVKGAVPSEVGERFPKIVGRAAYVV